MGVVVWKVGGCCCLEGRWVLLFGGWVLLFGGWVGVVVWRVGGLFWNNREVLVNQCCRKSPHVLEAVFVAPVRVVVCCCQC